MSTQQYPVRAEPVNRTIVTITPKEIREGNKVGWQWDWGQDHNEIDARISAPCQLVLWEDDVMEGFMSNCKNVANPFSLSFWFKIDFQGFRYGWRVCSRDFGEGGRGEIRTQASY